MPLMGLRRLLLPFAFVLGSSLLAASAHAAPTPRDRTDAAVFTNKARAASSAKRYDEAADLLRKADQLDPTPQRKIDLAKALVPLGKLVEASSLLNSVINDTTLGPKDKGAKDQAKKQLAQFESRIPWLSVHVVGPTKGAHVEIDGKEVEPDAEAPIDPGSHKVGVDCDGWESGDRSVTVAEGEHKQITITLTPGTKTATAKPKSSGGTKWPAVASFVLGAAGIGVGSAFGIMAFDETAKAKQFCDGNRCPARPEVLDARNVAIANGNVSTVGFVVGGVGVAAGIVLLLTVGASNDKPAEKKDALVVVPYVGAGEVGVVGTF
jgi:hypothetical protein